MCAAALLIAIAAANLARNIAVDWIYNVVYSDEKYEQDITDMLQSLQDYVKEEQVTEDNIKLLVNWGKPAASSLDARFPFAST